MVFNKGAHGLSGRHRRRQQRWRIRFGRYDTHHDADVIDGVSPWDVIHAYVAAGTALLIRIIAARQQDKYQAIVKDVVVDSAVE